MQAIQELFKTQLGKIILVCVGLYVLAFTVSKVGYYFVFKDEPPVVKQLVKSAKSSRIIFKKIGKISDWKYTYDERELEKDSLKLYIGLSGEKATVKMNISLAKDAQGGWRVIKSDTAYGE